MGLAGAARNHLIISTTEASWGGADFRATAD
jgi:hypothetical protein